MKIIRPIKTSANVATLKNTDLTNNHSNIFVDFRHKNANSFDEINRSVFSVLRNVPAFVEFLNKFGENYKNFEVVFPKGVLEKLKSGEYIMNKKKDLDEFLAFVKDKKTGKMVTQLRLKDISNVEKLNNLAPSLQNMAVLNSISQLSKQLESIEKKLSTIHKEFNNDRIGKIQAGYSAYLDAIQIENIEVKNKALISAYKSISEGRSQLIESAKLRLTEIKTGFWTIFWKELRSINYKNDIKESILEFKKEVFYIQRASQIILTIYQELKEPKAMVQSLAPLQDMMTFINHDFNVLKLNEWDKEEVNWKQMTSSSIAAIKRIPIIDAIGKSEITLQIN